MTYFGSRFPLLNSNYDAVTSAEFSRLTLDSDQIAMVETIDRP